MDIHVDVEHDDHDDRHDDRLERREIRLLRQLLAEVTDINRFLHRPVIVQVPTSARASVK